MINFLDNNFSDDRAHMLSVANMLGSHAKVRGWSALVTQNVLHDRELIRTLARLKCMVLFVGLESLDREMLRRFNKTQNMSRRFSVVDDIAFAESLGIAISTATCSTIVIRRRPRWNARSCVSPAIR
jgi:hypothetical protein